MNKNSEKGLTSQEAQKALSQFGYNEIPQKKEYTALKILVSQFTSFLIVILIIAGAISIALGELIDGLAILTIVLINTIIGFFQEYKAENAVKTLTKLQIQKAIVVRDAREEEIDIKMLVPGDIVLLQEGEKIPADMNIIEAFSLKVDQSMLTGESEATEKFKANKDDGKLFSGTIITSGHGKAVVTSTGKNTEFGKIVHLVSQAEETRSPLAIQLDQLGKKIGLFVLMLIIILIILGLLRGFSWINLLMTSVALGVSAIPEGLPIIVTLTLTMGVQILARKKAIVRKMNAIETLGATTIICSDKTGTLTLNEMTVKKIYTNTKERDIPGLGYDWRKEEKIILESNEEKMLLEIAENCNNSFVDKNILGDPTEIALKVLNRKAGFKIKYKQLDEKVFTSERKMMSSLSQKGKEKIIYCKGAYEVILEKSAYVLKNGKKIQLTLNDKKEIEKVANSYSENALRVLALAYKEYQNKFNEENLIFVGLVGMIDPPRKTVKHSLQIAQEAGIKVKIITGDNAITAKAIGKKVGMKNTSVITGDEIDKMTDSQLKKVLKEIQIFARTSPQHKYRIVDLLQKQGEVVAVTGDGVNDAPALKHSDVGIAMGIKGTEATKEVADIVLKDDNFTTIVNTIEEGRRIYLNILAFIKYMLAANYDEILTVGVLTILGYPLALLPLQILWINLVTDALPALALGKSPAPSNIMSQKPHPKKENIFKKFFGFIIITVVLQTAANLITFFYGLSEDKVLGIDVTDLSVNSHTRTLVFTQIVMFELVFAFVCKEGNSGKIRNIFNNKFLIIAVLLSLILQIIAIYSPFMQNIFKTVPLEFKEWLLVMGLASLSFFIPAISKLFKRV